MELVKDTPFEPAWLVWMARPKTPCLTVAVKATFTLVESGVCPIDPEQVLPTGDVHHDDDTSRSVRYDSDMAFIKPKGECFLSGNAYAPGGAAKTALLAAFKVGPIKKKMAIVGDRHYKGVFGGQSDPVPFTEMPLCWERCFGGKKNKLNPVGLGMDKSPVEGKAVVRLPNIEDPTELVSNKRQRPKPNGAFPIPRSWPARVKLTGTYDKRWHTTRWPWFPADFQWGYFNAAPEDQRINGFFAGDERISLVGLHSDYAKLECSLPGVRAKIFLREATTEKLKALSPELDTIAIDTDAGKVFCIWRAVFEVPSESLEEFSHLYVAHEPLDEDRPLEVYEQRFLDLQARAAAEQEAFEAEQVPEDENIEEASFSPVVTPVPSVARSSWLPSGEASSESSVLMRRTGSPFQIIPFPDPVPLDSPVLIPEMSDEEWEELHSEDYNVEDDGMRTVAEPGWIMPIDQVLEFRNFEFEEEAAPEPVAPPDNIFDEGSTFALLDRFALAQAMADSDPLVPSGDDDGEDAEPTALMEHDMMLSAIAGQTEAEALVEADATEMMPQGALLAIIDGDGGETSKPQEPPRVDKSVAPSEPEELPPPPESGTASPEPTALLPPIASSPPPMVTSIPAAKPEEPGAFEEPAWAGAAIVLEPEEDVTDSDEPAEDPAVAEEARRRQEQRERVLESVGSGESLAKQDLTGANLSDCDLGGGDFSGAILTDANLFGARLDGTNFTDAVFLRADLRGARLKGAVMKGTVLQEVNAENVRLEDVSFEGAVANDAVFCGAIFARCQCQRFELARADLTKAHIENTNLDGANMTRAKLDDALFIDSSLVDAELGAVSAKRVKMDECQLEKLRASEGGDFTEASFYKAHITGGRFSESILRHANFSFAELDGAVFTGAQLAQATMLGCKLRASHFDNAVLVSAKLGKSDLFQARFENANLLQADLRGCNLYNAEFLGADTRGAQLELANIKGTKLG